MIDLSQACLSALDTGHPPTVPGDAYGPPGGSSALRRAAARWYGVGPDCLAVTTGASLGLAAAFGSLPRSIRLLCPRPYYPIYPRLAALFGLDLVHFDLLPEHGWQPDPDLLLRLASRGPAAVLVNWPGNPTGTIASDETLEALRRMRDDHGCNIISDETYGDFVYDGRASFSLAELIGQRSVVTVKSGSKLLGFPGERIGFVIAEPDRLLALCHVHWTLALSPPAFGQRIALEKFDGGFRDKLGALVKDLEARRDLFTGLLRQCGCFDLEPPHGGTFIWARPRSGECDSVAFESLCLRSGVKVAGGAAFGLDRPAWFRASFAVSPIEIEQAAHSLIAAARGAPVGLVSAG